MPSGSPRILVTGANGHLGRQLIARLSQGAGSHGGRLVRALVRSERAAEAVRAVVVATPPELVIGDYTSEESMRKAVEGASAVVHLVGIIKEGGGASYEAAHEDTCRVLARVAGDAGVGRIVYLSIFGSHPDAGNRCLASKGRAEAILLEGATPTTVLRVPMVLGPDDHASAALRREALAGLSPMVGGGATLQQPIDSRDVIAAILAALDDPREDSVALDLGGPECLSHRELVRRAAALLGRKGPRVIRVPRALARAAIAVLERLSASPPVTTAMFDVLQHDDRVDTRIACQRLGLALTPLDETLRHCIASESNAS